MRKWRGRCIPLVVLLNVGQCFLQNLQLIITDRVIINVCSQLIYGFQKQFDALANVPNIYLIIQYAFFLQFLQFVDGLLVFDPFLYFEIFIALFAPPRTSLVIFQGLFFNFRLIHFLVDQFFNSFLGLNLFELLLDALTNTCKNFVVQSLEFVIIQIFLLLLLSFFDFELLKQRSLL